MDKNELKEQLNSLGINVDGDHIKQKDICKIDFNVLFNARYVTKAAPQKVGYLSHDLTDPVRNQEAATNLKPSPHETILATSQGELCLFDTALIFSSGEKWSQQQINEAIKQNYHVYLRNDNGDLYYANRQEIVDMNKDYLWGIDQVHRKRLTIISTQPL